VCFWIWRDRRPEYSSVSAQSPSHALPQYPSRIRSSFASPSGLDITDRNDGTKCASCCGAFRSWKFPWLFDCQSMLSESVVYCEVRNVLILNQELRKTVSTGMIGLSNLGALHIPRRRWLSSLSLRRSNSRFGNPAIDALASTRLANKVEF
jgi:hypothetical protein